MPNKLEYFQYKINTTFITKKLLYAMYMPIQMANYQKLKQEFIDKNLEINWKIGMIEKPKMFGFGWIGLSNENGDKKIQETFMAYKLVGNYKQMKDVYPKIMKDNPKAKTFYNLYLTDPKVTKMEDNLTYILFK